MQDLPSNGGADFTSDTPATAGSSIAESAITQRRSPRKTAHSTSVVRGFRDLKKQLDACSLDGRSSVARELSSLRDELVRDLGGESNCSSQQLALVQIIVREYLLLELFDGYLFSKRYLIDRRKRHLTNGAMDRLRLADSICRHLQALGLERRIPPRKI